MVCTEPLGNTRERFALKLACGPSQFLVRKNFLEISVAFLDQRAIRQQLVSFRRIDAAERQKLVGREMHVEDCTLALDRGVTGKNRGYVRFIGRLVFGKTRVAINAVHRLLRRRDITRRKARQLFVDARDQLQHRELDQRFILLLARIEPLAPVVALELAQESEGVGGETGESGFHRFWIGR